MLDKYEEYLNKILNFISYKMRSRDETERRLQRYLRDIEDKDIKDNLFSKIMKKVEDEGFIDDARYVKTYVEDQRLSSAPQGRYKMRTFLFKKGISKDLIDQLFVEYPEDIELEGAKKEAEKKMKSLNPLDFKDKNKLWQFLKRKGYSTNVVRTVIDSNFKV